MPTFSCYEIQTKDLNCGAFGLTAIFKAFGLLLTQKEKKICNGNRIAFLNQHLTFVESAEEIYKVTGNLTLTGGHSQEGEHYNSASAISYVAKQFGLHVALSASEKTIADFEKVFPGELMCCTNIVDEMFINNGQYNLPGHDECQLVVVATADHGYHWIAVDSRGVFYDPATGKVHDDWTELTDTYERLAIWLTFSLRRKSAQP